MLTFFRRLFTVKKEDIASEDVMKKLLLVGLGNIGDTI